MKSIHLISISTVGAICGLSLLGVAPRVLAADPTPVDVELALLIDYSSPDFAQVQSAHSALFTSGNFFARYVAPLPTQSIAVSYWVYADGVAQSIGWTLINSPTTAKDFGDLISGVVPTLSTDFTNMGQAIQTAWDPMSSNSINANDYEGVYKIFDLASNGVDEPSSGLGAVDAAKFALAPIGDENISAINSISTTQVDGSVLPSIIALPNNNNNPGGNRGFMLDNLSFEPDIANSSYETALAQKFQRELVGNTSIPEPSALWGLFGLSLVPLVKRVRKSVG